MFSCSLALAGLAPWLRLSLLLFWSPQCLAESLVLLQGQRLVTLQLCGGTRGGKGEVAGDSGRGAANGRPTESSTEGGRTTAPAFGTGTRKTAPPQTGSSGSVAGGPDEPGVAGEAVHGTGTGGHGCDFLRSRQGHPGEPRALPAAALPGGSWWPRGLL